jgi:Domain of Unknown Function (DUF1080)
MFRLMLLPLLAFAVTTATAADPKPIEAFNGKNLDGWKLRDEKKSKWKVMQVVVNDKEPAVFSKPATLSDHDDLVNLEGSCDLYTTEKFGDMHLEVEFMIPKGSNSGVYLMGEYEVQILDTYGKANDKLGPGDMGGIYSTAAPKVNACKKPGEWQKFVIDFLAPTFDGDKKIANGKFIKVMLNDTLIHENVEVTKSTGGGLTGKEVATGPLMLQGDHGPVAFRNIKISYRK